MVPQNIRYKPTETRVIEHKSTDEFDPIVHDYKMASAIIACVKLHFFECAKFSADYSIARFDPWCPCRGPIAHGTITIGH